MTILTRSQRKAEEEATKLLGESSSSLESPPPPFIADFTESDFEEDTESEIRSEMTGMDAPFAERRPMPKAPKFDGTTDVSTFTWIYDAYTKRMTWTDAEAIAELPFSLAGIAQEKYHHQWGTDSPATLKEALDSITRIFSAGKRTANDYSGLFSLRQKKDERVEEFIDRLNKEQQNIEGKVPDAILTTSLIKGLRAEIGVKLHEQNISSYLDALTAARTTERNLEFMNQRLKEQQIEDRGQKPGGAENTEFRPTPRMPFMRNSGGGPRPPFLPRPQGNWQTNRPVVNRPPFNSTGGAIAPRQATLSQREDPRVETLRKQLEGITLGSMAHLQLQETAKSEGRCFRCFSQQHRARECPHQLYPTNLMQEQEDMEDEYKQHAYYDEQGQDPEWAQ
jgi:hypothetical protein